ncbi:MAG: fumarate hydratase [Vallitaleaceae bacterium]|jgi:fumarate hydratase subunit alpha|nr:fumarate hydratase [Vallitaleaceae bacterium]
MREVHVNDITQAVAKMCIATNVKISPDILEGLKKSQKLESSPIGIDILDQLLQNAEIAERKNMPICQDTGMAVVFVEIGQEVSISGGLLTDAINEGVRKGYEEGYLRKSIVEDPFFRVNTNDNTPAVIHYDIVGGDSLKISLSPKGFGSENMSRIYMLKPSDGIEGAKRVILETIDMAGPNACPPMVVGVGIGGTFEKAAILAKKALIRPIDQSSDITYVSNLEKELTKKANQLGIGPQGMGGRTTVLGINIETFPTHIAGLPVAINISCHVTRHMSVSL